MDFAARMDDASRIMLARASVKRAFLYGVVGSLSTADSSMLSALGQHRLKLTPEQARRTIRGRPATRKRARTALPPLIGELYKDYGEVWYHRLTIGKCELSTEIDSGGRRAFQYEHTLRRDGGVIAQSISFLPTRGISSGTSWNSMVREPAEVLVDAVLKTMRPFIEALPDLLAQAKLLDG